MAATLLKTHRVEKPWGRTTLWPGFADPAPRRATRDVYDGLCRLIPPAR